MKHFKGSTKLLNARIYVISILKKMSISDYINQGETDVIELINFDGIAKKYHLSPSERGKLVNNTQKIVDKAVRKRLEISY